MVQPIVRAIIRKNNELLLATIKDAQFWSLPGGKVEKDEPLEAALEREIIEELGVKPKIGKLLFIQQLVHSEGQRLEFFFEVTNADDFLNVDITKTTHGFELDKVEFKNPAITNVLPEFLKTAKTSGRVQVFFYTIK